jgi:hypothetical protein
MAGISMPSVVLHAQGRSPTGVEVGFAHFVNHRAAPQSGCNWKIDALIQSF